MNIINHQSYAAIWLHKRRTIHKMFPKMPFQQFNNFLISVLDTGLRQYHSNFTSKASWIHPRQAIQQPHLLVSQWQLDREEESRWSVWPLNIKRFLLTFPCSDSADQCSHSDQYGRRWSMDMMKRLRTSIKDIAYSVHGRVEWSKFWRSSV